MRKILFRADAKPSIGTGDLVSLIHLSRYFEVADWQAHFMIRSYEAALSLAAKHNLKHLSVIGADISVRDEVDAINGYVSEHGIDAVFLEITERPLMQYAGITDGVFRACVCFDGEIFDGLDLVVGWDVEAHRIFDVRRYPRTEFFLGPRFVILPMSFDLEKAAMRKHSARPEKVLIAMGGADEFNFTQRVVDVLTQWEYKLTVVVGSGYQYGDKLRETLVGGKHVIKQNITNMFDEYLSCDIAIAAGGLTSYELVATKTPAILIAAYEHQIARCRYFHEKGFARYLGYRTIDENSLVESLRSFWFKPSADNYDGAHRIVEFIRKLEQAG